MYKTILVRELIDDGERLLKELDRLHFPISAAFWYDSPERLTWKLNIVSEALHQPETHGGYATIRQALTALTGASVSLDDIVVLSPRSNAFRDLRRTIEGVSQMSVSGQRVNLEGMDLGDAYVYRWSYHC